MLAGRWLSPRNPITGQFPANYERSTAGRCVVHFGGRFGGRLLVPVIETPRDAAA